MVEQEPHQIRYLVSIAAAPLQRTLVDQLSVLVSQSEILTSALPFPVHLRLSHAAERQAVAPVEPARRYSPTSLTQC